MRNTASAQAAAVRPSASSQHTDAVADAGRHTLFRDCITVTRTRSLTSGVRRRAGTVQVSIHIELRQNARPPDLAHEASASASRRVRCGCGGRRRGSGAVRRGGGDAVSRLEGFREWVSKKLERGAQPIAGAHLTHESHDPNLHSCVAPSTRCGALPPSPASVDMRVRRASPSPAI